VISAISVDAGTSGWYAVPGGSGVYAFSGSLGVTQTGRIPPLEPLHQELEVPIPEVDSVFRIIDIGSSEEFWVVLVWKAARS